MDFNTKIVTGEKEGHFIMIYEANSSKDLIA